MMKTAAWLMQLRCRNSMVLRITKVRVFCMRKFKIYTLDLRLMYCVYHRPKGS